MSRLEKEIKLEDGVGLELYEYDEDRYEILMQTKSLTHGYGTAESKYEAYEMFNEIVDNYELGFGITKEFEKFIVNIKNVKTIAPLCF